MNLQNCGWSDINLQKTNKLAYTTSYWPYYSFIKTPTICFPKKKQVFPYISEKQLGHPFVHIRKICRWPGLKQYHSLVSNLRFEQQLRLEKWYRQLGPHRKILGEDICFFNMISSEFLNNSSSIILSPSTYLCKELKQNVGILGFRLYDGAKKKTS